MCCFRGAENPDVDPVNILPDGRFSHIEQINERLKFLRFLLKDGQLWLCEPQAKQVRAPAWVYSAGAHLSNSDRALCSLMCTSFWGNFISDLGVSG